MEAAFPGYQKAVPRTAPSPPPPPPNADINTENVPDDTDKNDIPHNDPQQKNEGGDEDDMPPTTLGGETVREIIAELVDAAVQISADKMPRVQEEGGIALEQLAQSGEKGDLNGGGERDVDADAVLQAQGT
jgi:hypothetical protein